MRHIGTVLAAMVLFASACDEEMLNNLQEASYQTCDVLSHKCLWVVPPMDNYSCMLVGDMENKRGKCEAYLLGYYCQCVGQPCAILAGQMGLEGNLSYEEQAFVDDLAQCYVPWPELE